MASTSFTPRSRRALTAGAVFLFINGFFVAKVPQATRPELAGVSAFFVLVLAAPSFWSLYLWLGGRRSLFVIASLGLFAIAIETFAVKTGYPYGHFRYGDKIGLKYFGVVPWTVPFAWSPLVLGAMGLARRITSKGLMWLAPLVLLSFDFVLDPGAVQQKFWIYDAGGFYYGVPLSNFVGWILSGFIGVWLFWKSAGKREDIPITLMSSITLILAFWTSVCLFTGLWVPALLGFSILAWFGREIVVST